MKNDPQNTIFHLLLTAKKIYEIMVLFPKKKKGENYNNGGIVRESPPRDFRIILKAKYFFWWSKVNWKSYFMDRFS